MDFVNRATGATKEKIGKALGNTKLEAEGHAQRAQALGEQGIKSAKDTAENTAAQGKSALNQAGDKVKSLGGDVKQKVGEAIGSQKTAAQGGLDKAEAAVKDTIHGK
ncbi:hypothetical protein H4S07_001306 [Coemansia furcata]|uniref:Uncharacterized protein n=1 Tax=Coemansia furcata TaxID=417177 RepID=A0ACC1LPV7_9FUNG|nr:hypothetical protein H4S07_001306 [Coemansia furcata]